MDNNRVSNRNKQRDHKMFNAIQANDLNFVVRKNGNMVNVAALNTDGSFTIVHTEHHERDIIGAEGETPEEAICEALMMVGIAFDEAFDISITIKYTWG